MRRDFIINLLLLALSSLPVLGEEASRLDEAACRAAFAALPRPETLRADFTQEKTLPDVAKPLRTQGELLVSAQHGVILRTLQPAFAQGSRVLPLPRPGQEPANLEARIGRTVQSVLSGDFGPLTAVFAAEGERADRRLTVVLTPKTPQVKAALTRLTLRFGEHLEEVVVEEAGGGRIVLRFARFRPAPAPTAQELQEFGTGR
jgi:hypothetical protein